MLVIDDKLVSCTKAELYSLYLNNDWDELFPFAEYLQRVKNSGVTVYENSET